MAVVKKQSVARNGEVVVAMIDSEAVIKRLRILKNAIKLESANPAYPPLVKRDVKILGKVIGIIRRY